MPTPQPNPDTTITGNVDCDAVIGGPPQPWPADTVERWPVDRLLPYANNARVHTDADVDAVAASIREFGWTLPVLADEHGNLIAGHCRVLAAKKLGLATVPVMVARDWTGEQKRAYRLADNQLATRATWV